MRQVVLDTETTGLEPNMGHRIIEIGAVEIVNRKLTGRHYHQYVNPERDIDDGALEVHGITEAFLADKPKFQEIMDSLIAFVSGADLVIHNAPFDLSFLNYELKRIERKHPKLETICTVTDSLVLARQKHPGQKNNLDALCRRYEVDNSQRELHGALLDAEILADVYLLMTGGQTSLFGGKEDDRASSSDRETNIQTADLENLVVPLVRASHEEEAEHEMYLDFLREQSGADPVWRTLAH